MPRQYEPADESCRKEHIWATRVHSQGLTPTYSARSDNDPEDTADTQSSDDCLGNATPSEIADLYDQHDAVHQSTDPHAPVEKEAVSTTALHLLEEARAEGLCHDTLLDYPLASACVPTPPTPLAGDLDEWPGLAPDHKAAAVDLVDNGERWDVDRESAEFLASLLVLGKADVPFLVFEEGCLIFTDLKIDEPILQCHPDVEVRRLRDRNAVKLASCGFKPFALDAEEGESVSWPSANLVLPTEKEKEVASEKLDVDAWLLEPQTPPLLPLSPPFNPTGPPTSLLEFPLTSTPENLMAVEAANVGNEIMEHDERSSIASETLTHVEGVAAYMVDMHSALRTPDGSSSSPAQLKRLEDVKAELPLLPTSADQSPPEKAKASFLDEHDFTAFVVDVVTPLAEPANAQAGNEQLLDFDTTMRIAVPRVDDTSSMPPWLQYCQPCTLGSQLESQRALLSFTRREILKSETSWSGVSKLERTLGWSPFPARLGKLKSDEEFDDDGSAARYMGDLVTDDDFDIDGLITKAEGLRILDGHESDEDDVEPADVNHDMFDQDDCPADPEQKKSELPSSPPIPADHEQAKTILPLPPAFPPRIDMQTLLRKRKQELESASRHQSDRILPSAVEASQKKAPKRPRLQEAATGVPGSTSLLDHGGIAGFMQLHGSKLKTYPSAEGRVVARTQAAAPPAVMVPPSEDSPSTSAQLVLPAPQISNPERAMQVVVSTTAMTDRALIRQLHALLPGLEMIERAHIHQEPQSGKALAESLHPTEADLTLSPATGLLTTTVQQLKQKALPGQTDFFGLRERIEAVSRRYERLIVLVLHAQQLAGLSGVMTRGLAERDCDALSELMAFTASLETDVEVHLVLGSGGDLGKWIAAAISQHSSVVGGDMQLLLPDETLWERFLRTAGLNAFAAQVILGQSRQAEGMQGVESSSVVGTSEGEAFGLAAFVRLSPEQRVRRFGPVLGGERVLGRVSEVVDGGGW
ncbi:hypothetical protein B0A55_02172 [Friedmanniomyces simplex]|uniref:Uncharacterized protein n=1 Tax=Friedmanniomyces simplex TaxID=329884 RepID=A0A4U0XZN1_9PEZI|nr:hypothetical protein B0A55_02172 [Friedmanniomyces simplex]